MRVTATIVLVTAITVDAIAQNQHVAAIIALVIAHSVLVTVTTHVYASVTITSQRSIFGHNGI